MIRNLGQVWKVEAPAVGSALALSQAIGRGYRLVEDGIDGIYREGIDYFETEQGAAASIFNDAIEQVMNIWGAANKLECRRRRASLGDGRCAFGGATDDKIV